MLSSLLLLISSADAFVYIGNPNLDFRIDRPADDYLGGTVTLDKVRVNHCAGGSTDYQVDQTLDPVAVYTLTIAGGDHCSVTYYWASAIVIDGEGQLGPFTVRYSQATTTVQLKADIEPVALNPYSVASGSMSGGAPWLLMDID